MAYNFRMIRLFIAIQLIGLGTVLLFHAAVGAWLLGIGVLGVIAAFAWRLIRLAA